jgi:membrane protease YdiL (CAAX protease family)
MDLDQPGTEGQGPTQVAFPSSRVPWSVREGLLLVAAFILVHQAVAVIVSAVLPGQAYPAVSLGVASGVLLMLLCFLLRAWSKSASGAFRVIGLQVPPLGPAIRRSIVPLLLAIVVLPAYMIARAGMLQYMDIAPVQQPIVTRLKTLHGEGQVAHLCVLVFLAVAVAPLVEELVFRGMLYLPLRGRVGPVPAAAVVSAVFAALHWGSAALVENLAVMGYLIILALILTALMEAARTMLAPILAHAAHNAVMIGLILLAGSGG